MWLMSREGFFSVVAHRAKPGRFLIRARKAEHLMRLLDIHWRLSDGKRPVIRHVVPADYPVRIEVSKAALRRLMLRVADSITYPNFKASTEDDPEYLNFLHGVWRLGREQLDEREL